MRGGAREQRAAAGSGPLAAAVAQHFKELILQKTAPDFSALKRSLPLVLTVVKTKHTRVRPFGEQEFNPF